MSQATLQFYGTPAEAIAVIERHAAGLVSFSPASLEFFYGIDPTMARTLCDKLMIEGKLNRFRIGGDFWYSKQ